MRKGIGNRRLAAFGTTIFSEMTQLASEHAAINLAQGFPDFEGPRVLIDAVIDALNSGHNQYSRSQGDLGLCEFVAEHQQRHYGLEFDPSTEIACFHGATEAIAATLLGSLEPGDEVIVFEPFYDSYPACLALSGATPVYVTLRFPDFGVDVDELASAFSSRTRAVLLNSPHNPTGKVFTKAELECLADLIIRHEAIAICDEVYEHLTYGDAIHVPLATIDGMRERTVTISSVGKTYSFTGWKTGWASGPRSLIGLAQAAHQFLTFCATTPVHAGLAAGLRRIPDSYYGELRSSYRERRDLLSGALSAAGLTIAEPRGSYFVLADFSARFAGDDIVFARDLTTRIGVAAIPPSAFYARDLEAGRRLIRFAFCKQLATLERARKRLAHL